MNVKLLLFLLFLISFSNSEIFTKKCLKWKNSLVVSCGYIYNSQNYENYEIYAEVEWYFRNQRILRSIDDFCETCNLKNELFMFELDKKYKIYFENNKIYFKYEGMSEIFEIFETEENQNLECFECFLNLYH